MSNIRLIPLFGPGTTFAITNNSDWLDSFFFGQPGFPAALTPLNCAITSGSATITTGATGSLMEGMSLFAVAPGIPASAYVGTIPTATTLLMVDAQGVTLLATKTDPDITVYVGPPPLDLTGITFTATLRRTIGAAQSYLVMKSADGTIQSGDKNGTMNFNIPDKAAVLGGTQMQGLPAGTYVMDIVATDGINTINLFPQGPATVTVSQAVTIP